MFSKYGRRWLFFSFSVFAFCFNFTPLTAKCLWGFTFHRELTEIGFWGIAVGHIPTKNGFPTVERPTDILLGTWILICFSLLTKDLREVTWLSQIIFPKMYGRVRNWVTQLLISHPDRKLVRFRVKHPSKSNIYCVFSMCQEGTLTILFSPQTIPNYHCYPRYYPRFTETGK